MEEKLQENGPENTTIVPTEAVTAAEAPAQREPFFAKINLSPELHTASGINIKLHDTLVHITPDAPEGHVRMVLEVLAHAQ